MIRVLVVDDEELVREALQRLLDVEDGIRVQVRESSGALDAVRYTAPDVVLLDVVMPAPDGLTLLASIRELPDPPPVAMLTTFDASDQLELALLGGAAGFLLKDSAPALLAQAVRVLAAGGVICTPGGSHAVLARHLTGRPVPAPVSALAEPPLPELTRREREVLTLIAIGLPNADIAEQLAIGVTTVKTHITALKRKLRASNRVALATVAQRAGLA
ncbi:response regulator transcription factor [Streptomyces sp. 549]|uniref:response regulator transcription factor n=1 Tax=Streptomyces sp. 549 TaxID=3049076 RepID=UPI0024C3C3DC|nr:response regulator transcription factor [Streptomyces sp. 549]MDK1475994.1 response regulator transcription factor [Streptomyces sp. 549]